MAPSAAPILDVRDLCVTFLTKAGPVPAVKSVSFDLSSGETLGLVGESGSGKSVTSLALIGLLDQGAELSGEIWFRDPREPEAAPIDLLQLSPEARRQYRGKLISMIFQEPLTSLNPVYTCGAQVIEALRLHQGLKAEAAKAQTIALFEEVKLPNPTEILGRYPHQLSGGMRQRVSIARSIAVQPDVLLLDEPFSALDIQLRRRLQNFLSSIWKDTATTMVLVTHNVEEAILLGQTLSVIGDRPGRIIETVDIADDTFRDRYDPGFLALQRHLEGVIEIDVNQQETLLREKSQEAVGKTVKIP